MFVERLENYECIAQYLELVCLHDDINEQMTLKKHFSVYGHRHQCVQQIVDNNYAT